ncbi:MAG: 50S ribosomal protein L6 [gamma proteobacterium symbiont of Bathyaustriella thionipta]|nr:50S ribosomal protein L6 [gamma proteobacterium symbiont of Bathyaustriella thionipta]
MSRIAKAPISSPSGVEVSINEQKVSAKGPLGSMEIDIHPSVEVSYKDNTLTVKPRADERQGWAMAGTMRANLNNMVVGVSKGFEKSLTLVGVGYRAQAKGKILNLSLGFSHPVDFTIPEGIKIETPSPTEIKVSGYDRQVVGQVAAKIRAYRPPEPYKGKGVRYSDEIVVRKEAKKK